MEEVQLTGYAFSPINPAWALGPVDVTFDFAGPVLTNTGPELNRVAIQDFSIAFSGNPLYVHLDSASGQYAFTPAQSFFAVYTPDASFIFEWVGNVGGFRDSMQQVNMQFDKESVTQLPTEAVGEPSALMLWAVAVLVVGCLFFWRREHTL